MGYKDKLGQPLEIGDTVVYGHDNGSSLEIGKVIRLTPQRVWMDKSVQTGRYACRYFDRVVKLKGK